VARLYYDRIILPEGGFTRPKLNLRTLSGVMRSVVSSGEPSSSFLVDFSGTVESKFQ
jgi:hypothetical protein